MIRIGQGYDVHAFAADRELILGGVRIDSPRGGLRGHSDADVLSHAVASALLGSLALGDLGTHFPDSDPHWKGISSLKLLTAVRELLGQRGWRVQNVDATVIAEEPRLAPHIQPMRANLARTLEIDIDAVSVKATTHEKLGSLGRTEGIAAQAVVLVTND